MVFNLKIENRAVDFPDGFELSFSENSNIFSTPEKIQTAVTNTITLPFTPTNRDVFEFIELPSRATSFLTTAKEATLEIDGYPIMEGMLSLLSISTVGYEVVLVRSDVVKLLLTAGKISDIDLTELWTYFEPDSTIVTDGDYGIFNYNYGNNLNLRYAQRSPAIRINKILSRINSIFGGLLTITGNFDDDKYLILTKNINKSKSLTPIMNYNINGNSVTPIQLDCNDLHPKMMLSQLGKLVVFDKTVFSAIKFETELNNYPTESVYLVHKDKDGNNKRVYEVESGTIFTVGQSQLADEDYFIVATMYNDADIDILVTPTLTANTPFAEKIEYNPQGYESQFYFPIYKNCDFSPLDFVRQMQLLEGVFLRRGATPNELILEPYNNIVDRENAVDYSNKFISLGKTEFQYENWGKENFFGYSANDEEINGNYNSCSFLLSNYQLQDLKQFTSMWATGTTETPMRINQYDLEYKLQNIPLVYAKKVDGVLKAVPFLDILTEKYDKLIKALEDFRMVEINLRLDPIEYKNFDINKLFYIKFLGKYFYPVDYTYSVNSGVMKINAWVLSGLSGTVNVVKKELTQSALATATSAGALAQQTYALVISDYQEKLVSGENIKTINGESLLGGGNIEISGGGGVVDNDSLAGEGTAVNPFKISEEYKLRINAGI